MIISLEDTNLFEAWGVEFDEGVYNKRNGLYVSCVTPMTWNTDEPTITIGFIPVACKDEAFVIAKQLKKISIRGGFLDCSEIEGFINLSTYEDILTQETDCSSTSSDESCNITEIPVKSSNEGFRLMSVL